jgi:hypothetical protein
VFRDIKAFRMQTARPVKLLFDTIAEEKQLGAKNILLKYIVNVTYSETTDGSLFLFNKYCILYGVKAARA